MSMYECRNCGEDDSDEPIISLVFSQETMRKYPTKNYTAFFHGGALKPDNVSL